MPFVAHIGETVETLAEVRFQWKIKDFFSLSNKMDDYYDSPVFNFTDSQWNLRLYPNGEIQLSSGEMVSLYLRRIDKQPLKTVSYTFGILRSDGRVEENAEESDEFSALYEEWGDELCSRSKLREQASTFMPCNILTITCHLKCSNPRASKVSLSGRLLRVSRNLKRVLVDGRRTDFTLKLGDREWPVHKVILEGGSEYFANMFRHEWAENAAGEVEFEDIEEEALDNVLNFVYTGEIEDLTTENVCDTYVAAHKFLLDDLRTLCIEFASENMCPELFCRVLVVAVTYGEGDLYRRAVQCFSQFVDQILESGEWEKLRRNHPSIVSKLLGKTRREGGTFAAQERN